MRDPNKFRRVALPAFFGAVLVLLILSSFIASEVFVAVALILAAAFVALFLIFWRCPSCGRLLPNSGFLKCCPYCGHKFDENE
ncbi:MAG TPA: hypothetical protein DHU74_05670 [Clostridiales bacterium]|jgi:uncharacterized membrane protein YobD (UPF0266 family)|nr:MAG: hypothetical protein BHW36_10880 [Firmicutes bacterium CAG:24053_14]HCY79185.1 hypothetical protein [Clostridiales bacterium]